ncbi:MAG: tRNA epoxyqueuosine(34) reductase QueG [Candidatus Puniceispirillaceae bacterium]
MAKEHQHKDWIKAKAIENGFDSCHITNAQLPDITGQRLDAFLKSDFHGEMAWLAETAQRRASPEKMWQEAQSAIVLGMNYGPDHNPLDNLNHMADGNISVYARGRDYHEVIKGKLKQLAGQIAARLSADVKVFVDTAPLMEKPLAVQSGLGWQGKHTNLVSREFGSWLFIGIILTNAQIAPDSPESDHCGNCTACLDICPTKAFPAPYQLDARRCISYMTIEQKTQIAPEFRKAIGNRIFGCDDCLAICPWNKFAKIAHEQKLTPRHDPALMPLSDLLKLDEAAFRQLFASMPVRRAGYERFMRNVLIGAGNAGDERLVPLILPYLASRFPLVQSMAIWALSCYLPQQSLQDLYQAREDDHSDDDMIESEWKRALT